MLKLLIFKSAFGQFSPSPFCVKAAYLLQLSGQPWQREDLADPRKTRYGKLPVLRAGGDVIADSDNIRAWLEQRGADFDPGLSARDKAVSRMIIRTAEEHLYFAQLMDRWAEDDVWPTVRDVYFKDMPPVLRTLIANSLRKTMMKGMQTQGMGRFTTEERMQRIEPDLVALAAMLDGQPYLFGDRITAADISVVSILSGMRATPVETALSRRISSDLILSAYVDRFEEALPLPMS